MTVTSTANPRRTSLSALTVGSELATCQGVDGQRCHNVAVLVQRTADGGRALVCRAHAAR
jgi:hypothetical protein